MKIWKTEEEAFKTACMYTSDSETDRWDPCSAANCGHWSPRKCPSCKGDGSDGYELQKDGKYKANECLRCHGTGHDGSNLGRCGLAHL